MNSIRRNLSLALLTLCTIVSANCLYVGNDKKEILLGDWILIGDGWHPGFRLTIDSIFPMWEQGGLLRVNESFGEPYELVKNDSLIFGSQDEPKINWGIQKKFSGSWKIIDLSEDSLTVEDYRGRLQFYKR